MRTYSVETLIQLANTGNEFYRDMLADFKYHGALTAAQVDALVERDLEPNPHPYSKPVGVQVNASHLEKAFAHAKAKGAHQPSITLHGFRFMPADPARAQPVNRNAIFVTSTSKTHDGTYLGKVLGGAFLKSPACTPALAASIGDAMEDPFKAAVEYGHMTGQCSVCNRPLTNPKSVQMGIGPVCRAKFGW